MKLIVVAEDGPLGEFLSAVADGGDAPPPAGASTRTLDEAQLVELDAFRIAAQGRLLGGCDLIKHLPPPKPRPRLTLTLRQDLSRAARAVAACLETPLSGPSDDEDAPLTYARWVAKRVLRSGMELAASSGGYDGFSRDLLPCHEAIVATMPSERAHRLSLKLLQLCCAPEDAVKGLGGGAAVALELLEVSKLLNDELEGVLLASHFQRPLLDFSQLPEPPPLAVDDDAAERASPSPFSLQHAKARLTSTFWRASMAARSGVNAASSDASRVISDPLPPLTLGFDDHDRGHDRGYPTRGARVLDLDWRAAVADGPRRVERIERIAQRAVRTSRRPVVLRGAATDLAPLGSAVWNLDNLPRLIPEGRVRVAPDATFTFCKESHPLCVSGAFPPPSRVVEGLGGEEFARRIRRRSSENDEGNDDGGGSGSSSSPPLFFGAGERYYMQADLPPAVLRSGAVPPLWRSLGVQQAQALRLWVSTHGAITPMHFDACASFLAQVRGDKRIVFFSPEALDGLYPFAVDHPLHRRSRVDLYEDADERRASFPSFDELALPFAQQVMLREGDVVLFPKHWYHHIETTSAMSWSVGCRYV